MARETEIEKRRRSSFALAGLSVLRAMTSLVDDPVLFAPLFRHAVKKGRVEEVPSGLPAHGQPPPIAVPPAGFILGAFATRLRPVPQNPGPPYGLCDSPGPRKAVVPYDPAAGIERVAQHAHIGQKRRPKVGKRDANSHGECLASAPTRVKHASGVSRHLTYRLRREGRPRRDDRSRHDGALPRRASPLALRPHRSATRGAGSLRRPIRNDG